MKQVLILDAAPLFRDFIKSKLMAEKIQVDIAESRRDAFTKMVTTLPDLIIIDCEKTLYDAKEFLERKTTSPNTKDIPVIICGPAVPVNEIDELVPYGVVKYFHKPIRFDLFFEFLSKKLNIPFSLDTTQCILEIHVNNDILFIEIAAGLNRDKLALLKYKISEVLDSVKLTEPKVIVMLTDLTLSFVDGCNLEALFDSILADQRIKAHNVKVLSFDSFTKDLIAGHKEYKDISVATSIQSVLFSVVDSTDTNNMADFINDNILASTADISKGSMEMVYNPNAVKLQPQVEKAPAVQNFTNKTIAVVDDDIQQLAYLQKVLSQNFKIVLFNNGPDFIKATQTTHFDLTILDLNMPNMNGFDVLKILQGRKYIDPIIIYSAFNKKEAIFMSLKLGAKTFLAKPLKPEILIQKIKEVLSADI